MILLKVNCKPLSSAILLFNFNVLDEFFPVLLDKLVINSGELNTENYQYIDVILLYI